MVGLRSLAAACVLASATVTPGMAAPGAPIGNIIVKGGCNAGPDGRCPHQTADRVSIQLNLSRSETWTYEPIKGTLTPSKGANAAVNPIPGIGIVVKRNPGGGAAMAVPNGEGGNGQLPPLADGTYDIAIRVPNAAFTTRPANGGRQGVELTFTIVKRGDSVINLVLPGEKGKGAGSPKAAGY